MRKQLTIIRKVVLSLAITIGVLLPPSAHAGVADNTLWVLGGNSGGYLNDVWCSTDNGVNWTEVTASSPWVGRMNHKVVVFQNQLWLFGGNTASGNLGDVWHTTGTASCAANGLTWVEAVNTGPWTSRAAGSLLVYNSKLWYMGGRVSGSTAVNDVWSSSDGVNWTQVTAAAPWAARDRMESIVFNNKIYMMGGRTTVGATDIFYNDVWSTTDGVNWTQEQASAPWTARRDFALYQMGSKIYLSSGRQGAATRFNDIWSSSDGINWTAETNAPWAVRYHPKVTKKDGVLYIAGGFGPSLNNDVWKSSDGLSWTQVNASAPWAARDHHQMVAYSTVPDPAVLTSRVYIDVNKDGNYDAADTLAQGATIVITPTGGGAPITVTTDVNGIYTASLAPGEYTFELQNSDPNYTIAEGSGTYTLTLASGEVRTYESDFGLQSVAGPTQATLSSRVYIDANANGTYDSGETPVVGATVTLTPTAGGTPIVLTTDSNGVYSTMLDAGTYAVVVSNIDPAYKVQEGNSGYTLTVAAGDVRAYESDFGLQSIAATNSSTTTAGGLAETGQALLMPISIAAFVIISGVIVALRRKKQVTA